MPCVIMSILLLLFLHRICRIRDYLFLLGFFIVLKNIIQTNKLKTINEIINEITTLFKKTKITYAGTKDDV